VSLIEHLQVLDSRRDEKRFVKKKQQGHYTIRESNELFCMFHVVTKAATKLQSVPDHLEN